MKKEKIISVSLLIFITTVLFFGSFSNVCAQCVNQPDGTPCTDPETNVTGTCTNGVCFSSTSACSHAGGTCVDECPEGNDLLDAGVDNCAENNQVCCRTGNTPAGSTATVEFTNPLTFNSVQGVLGSLLNSLQGIIVVISLVFIVIGAILYITSTGNDQRMEMAKKAITASMIGLAIGIAAPSFLKEIYDILGGTPTIDCSGLTGADLERCNQANATLTSGLPLVTIVLNVLNFLLSIVGTIALIMLIVGAIMYLTAAGNEDQIDRGKKLFRYALIGITIALASLVIVKQIAGFFGG